MTQDYEIVYDKNKARLIESFVKEKFSIKEFASERGAKISDYSDSTNCLFHEDLTPSLFINDEKGIWKCHSCGRGGGYIKFVEYYMNLIEGYKLNYYTTIEYLLRTNKDLSSEFGNSIRSEVLSDSHKKIINNFSMDSLADMLNRNTFKFKESRVLNKMTLSNLVKSMSLDKKIQFSIMLQNGESLQYIKDVLEDKVDYSNIVVNIDDLVKGD